MLRAMKSVLGAMLGLTASLAHAGDPNDHFDGDFNSSFGWNLVGGYSGIADGVLNYEGRDAVNAYAYADLADDAVAGDFELYFQTMITSANINPNVVIGGLGDAVGKYSAWNNGLFVVASNHDVTGGASDGSRFALGYRVDGFGDHSEVKYIQSFQWSSNTWYYMTLARRGSTATLEVFADSARTQLLGAESHINIATVPLRYLYAFTGAWAGYDHEVIYGLNDSYSIGVESEKCRSISGLKTKCKYGQGRFRIRATAVTELPEGTLLGLCLDVNGCGTCELDGTDDCKEVVINSRGKGKARWSTTEKGSHCVIVRECPEITRCVSCLP